MHFIPQVCASDVELLPVNIAVSPKAVQSCAAVYGSKQEKVATRENVPEFIDCKNEKVCFLGLLKEC